MGWAPGYAIQYLRYLTPVFPYRYSTLTMTANRCYLMPIQVPIRLTVDRICIPWAGTVAGNIRAGIYKDNGETPEGGDLLVESASVAKSGTNRLQEITITDTQLDAGLYWVAIQGDESTTEVERSTGRYYHNGALQEYYYDLGAYGPFTDPCPAVTVGGNYCPLVVLRVKEVYQP